MKTQLGMPVRITFLNPKQIDAVKITWKATVTPKEKKTSELSKVMFDAMIQSAMALQLPLNPEYIMEKFAEVWELDSSKLYDKNIAQQQQAQQGQPQGQPQRRIQAPKVNVQAKPQDVIR